jgi:hypothetical protein
MLVACHPGRCLEVEWDGSPDGQYTVSVQHEKDRYLDRHTGKMFGHAISNALLGIEE